MRSLGIIISSKNEYKILRNQLSKMLYRPEFNDTCIPDYEDFEDNLRGDGGVIIYVDWNIFGGGYDIFWDYIDSEYSEDTYIRWGLRAFLYMDTHGIMISRNEENIVQESLDVI